MAVSGSPMGVTGLHLVRCVDNDRTLRWVKDKRDGLPPSGVDLTGWDAVFRMGLSGGVRWVYETQCRTTGFGDIRIRIPATAFASQEWDGRRSGVWRVDVTSPDGTEVLAAAGGHWLMSDHAGPGDDQIPDLVTLGVPDPVEDLLLEVQGRHEQVEALHDDTQRVHDETVSAGGALMAQAQAAAERAAGEARKALAWVQAGQGVSLGPEPPSVARPGHVWLVEDRVARTPLYPSAVLHPDPGLVPQRSGWLPSGSHVVTGVSRLDDGGWTEFTLAPTLLAGASTKEES